MEQDMDKYVEDNDGGKLTIEPHPSGKITLTLESQGWAHNEVDTSRLNMVDPDEVIYAIMKACEQEKDCPGPVIEALADQINHGIEARIDFPNGGPKDPEEPDTAESAEEQTAAEAHQHLAEHWSRRMDVVQRALTMLPAPGKRGGLAAAFSGEEIEQADRVEKALKIARFAADEDRDIPGVDR